MLQDRRQYPRLVPAGSPLFVHMGEHTRLLANISEGGLAVYGLPEIQGEVFSLTLDLPHCGSPMRATAQIAWTSDLKRRTGVRFVDLPAKSRQQLRDWMSALTDKCDTLVSQS